MLAQNRVRHCGGRAGRVRARPARYAETVIKEAGSQPGCRYFGPREITLEKMAVTGPSLRFTTASLFGDMPVSRTEYACGLNTRSESRSCSGHSAATPPANGRYEYGPWRAYIHNRDIGYRFELEIEARIYTACRVDEYGSPVWTKPQQIPPPKRSGRTVHSHTDTIDTGDRKEMFGHTARHIITKSSQTRDGELLSESESDGWYIDPPMAWLNVYPPKPGVCDLGVSSGMGERDDYKFTETGKSETGFMLLVTRTHKSFLLDQDGTRRVHEAVYRDEVAEFSEAPLHADLFVPPHGYRRVLQLPAGVRYPLPHRVRLCWELLKDRTGWQKKIAQTHGLTW